ncbi:FAD-dependent oxidoreductase [Streptomyces sp. 71268]|uniref:FAD-dependent oxidoreductase n=1 Tax=Streptomyces sp. 71268 TaxID=3002640 RepID=UPI0023F7B07F|nr:FAD-dependent oxidoreductase [Streptomyces sp. 71268]WEV24082.1 FAD-dependent oxidoreductase [Streptomyces sp. 71268]
MTRTPPRAGATGTNMTDLIIVGGGPAGCAAARMAASVGLRSVLVEPDAVCHNLHRVPVLDNVPGGHTSGPALADSLAAELHATTACRVELGRRVTHLRADDDQVTVELDDGTRIAAPHAVVATGVGPRQPGDVGWLTAPADPRLPPLWAADAADAKGRTLLVLGGDRPIGTFLRAHPRIRTRLLVAYPVSDDYKVEEVGDDPRVTLLPVRHLTLPPGTRGAPVAQVVDREGRRRTVTADAAFLSIGSTPTAPLGDLVRDASGYCPPDAQHPRVSIAGDLRSARYQRIATAIGSGSEAALRAYYAARDLLA